MQCHPGLCLSLCCDFTLEPLTRGLSSKDANQHPQRLVAVIARRSLPCYTWKWPISPSSRPDHNAAAPFALGMFAPSRVRRRSHLRPSRNCQTAGGAAGAVKPAARQGRSEAEWLDRAEDRRTILS